MSPNCHIGNGCTDLILISKCSRFSYFRYLLSLASTKKNSVRFIWTINRWRLRCFLVFQFDFNFVDAYRVREFSFTPTVELTKRRGYTFEKDVDFDEGDVAVNDGGGIDYMGTSTMTSDHLHHSSNNNHQAVVGTSDNGTTILRRESSAINGGGRRVSVSQLIGNNKRRDSKRLSPTNVSVWNCDGEVLDDASVHVKVHCQLVTIYATGFDAASLVMAHR